MIGTGLISLLAFPVNMIMSVAWVYLLFLLWVKCPKSLFVRYMLSPGATILSVSLFLLYCFAIGLTGKRELVHTWGFALIMLFLLSVLQFVLMRGWRAQTATGARLGAIRWRFVFLHAGLIIALGSAFWGFPDSDSCRLRAWKGEIVNEAHRQDGTSVWLKYDVILEDFALTYGLDGKPSDYVAKLKVDGEEVLLRVNHPYTRSFGEDFYLFGYDQSAGDNPEYCILEIVEEPWKYAALVGVILMLAGALMLFIGGPRNFRDNEE